MTLPLTLTENWQSFNDKVIPANASDVQRTETRRAFHAGFIRCFELLTDHCASLDADDAFIFMDKLNIEVMTYLGDMTSEAGIDSSQLNIFTADEGKPQ
jgi:hypothetical protein